jgi:hypothetical protein
LGDKRNAIRNQRFRDKQASQVKSQKQQHEIEQEKEKKQLDAVDPSTLSIEERMKYLAAQRKREKLELKKSSKKVKLDDSASTCISPAISSSKNIIDVSKLPLEFEQSQLDRGIPADSDLGLILSETVIGFNSLTSTLESDVLSISTSESTQRPPSNLAIIFVCTGDISASHLYSHLPTLVTLASPSLILCPFPQKGAESALSRALGIHRVMMMGVKVNIYIYTFFFVSY